MQTCERFDAALTSSEQTLIIKARDFAARQLPQATLANSDEHRQLLSRACHEGLAGIEVPVQMGGASASFSTRMRVCEELARHHAGFAFSLVNHHNIVSRVAHSGQPALRDSLVPLMLAGEHIGCTAMTEPQSGSDFTALQTTAVPHDNGWLLNGAKAWITNASLADVFLVYAQTDVTAGAKGVGGFIVFADDPGFKRGPACTVAGTEGMGVGEFGLTDCFIPEERLLYPPGDGFYAAMRGVNQARVHVAAINAAMLDTALSTACGYSESRQAFGKPVMAFQGLSWSLAGVATHLEAMRLLAYAGAQVIDAGQDAQGIAAMAKKYANDHTLQAISTCMQAMGAHGLTPQAGLDRMLTWAKAFCYTDGTPEMMNERIVRQLRKVHQS
ncbi:acyl-CoA dehydrogenase family protein [Pusillimonas sp. ANT_WB101]|uniref:acyl-CoA dehydrogenase family protein n=1 Tax=Pusillimonas sp. ANT_WB101 TaxID=2597356 RepID=UPI0011EC658D|nr:acyl-CoA dehydrogenase family protein [Pusillimonas sp. ANT_WB101]KAA0890926.1 acyl-CoA dehydrogenase family protein [Pusillimonas sp. ANT_WB101]